MFGEVAVAVAVAQRINRGKVKGDVPPRQFTVLAELQCEYQSCQLSQWLAISRQYLLDYKARTRLHCKKTDGYSDHVVAMWISL